MAMAWKKDATGTALAALGLCFFYAWTYLSFNASSGTFWNLTSTGNLFYVHQVSGLTSTLAFVAAIALRLKRRIMLSPRATLACGAALVAGSLCCSPEGAPTALRLVGSFVNGLASPVLMLGLAQAYRVPNMRDVIISASLAVLGANAVNFASLLAPAWLAHILPAATAALAGAFTTLALRSAAMRDSASTNENGSAGAGAGTKAGTGAATGVSTRASAGTSARADLNASAGARMASTSSASLSASAGTGLRLSDAPLRFAAGLLAVSFAFGVGRVCVGRLDVAASTGGWPALWCVLGVCAAFLAWGALSQRNMLGLGAVYKAILPVLACAVTFIPLFGTEQPGTAIALFKACNAAESVAMWIILVNISRTTRASTILTAATVFAAHHLGVFLGQQLAWPLAGHATQIAIAAVFAIVVAASYMFEGNGSPLVFDAPSPDELDGDTDALARRVHAIAQGHGLTPREEELFSYWATGHSSRYVQDKMGISAETVKTHVRHIYEKCGVHSREEVIALLEQA